MPVFSKANINNKLLNKLNNTNTIVFDFEQQIKEKIEKGTCKIKYSKLMLCDYDDTYHKRILSNGKMLAIIQRRYKKIFYYSLKKTPLNLVLNKEFLIAMIKNTKPNNISNETIEFKINIDKKKKLSIFFDATTLNIKGWSTIDLYNIKVNFLIKNLKTNVQMDDKIFRIPRKEDL